MGDGVQHQMKERIELVRSEGEGGEEGRTERRVNAIHKTMMIAV